MVSVHVGYIYLGRGDLIAGHLEGCDGICLPSILFLVRVRHVVECELWYVTPVLELTLNLCLFEFKSWELLSFLFRCRITREIFINEIRELFFHCWNYYFKGKFMLICDIMWSFVTSLLLNWFLLFNNYRREIEWYILNLHSWNRSSWILLLNLSLIFLICLISSWITSRTP